MTAQTPVPGPHPAAAGPTAPPEGPGGVGVPHGPYRAEPAVGPPTPSGVSRPAPHRADERNDAGLLAFIVRDLMDAAGYDYSPDRPLHQQARECGQMIHRRQDQMSMLELGLINEQNEHAADVQRLTDLADELRKQLAAALRVAEHPTILAWRRTAAEMPTPTEWNDLIQEGRDLHDRVDSLDRLLQERDALIEAACPCEPGAPAHEHLTGGYALTWMSSQASDIGPEWGNDRGEYLANQLANAAREDQP